MRRPISFRWLLALIYLSSVVPLLLGAGVLVYREYREHVVDMTAARLREFVDGVVTRVEGSGGAAAAVDLEPVATSLALPAWTDDVQATVLDLDGRPVAPGSSEPSRREVVLHA